MRGRKRSLVALVAILGLLPLAPLAAQGTGGNQIDMMWVTWVGSIIALLFALYQALSVLKKDGGTIDAISGATITSRAAALGVAQTIRKHSEHLKP
jgi:Na+-translocating ferredoxin:NAD+ oxidoreductase RnfG subunit